MINACVKKIVIQWVGSLLASSPLSSCYYKQLPSFCSLAVREGLCVASGMVMPQGALQE